MPPQGIIARLYGLLSSPEHHDEAEGWHAHAAEEDQPAAAAAGTAGYAGAAPQLGQPAEAPEGKAALTAPEQQEQPEQEQEEQEEGSPDEENDENLAPLRLRAGKARSGSESYFDDQDGRVLRGSSRSTSLDMVVPPSHLQMHKRGLSWMTDLGTGPLSLAEFVELLPSVLERCSTRNMKKCEPVKRLLERLELRREEWAPFAFWDQDKLYTRNLVATDNKTFTLLLLCWNAGKESPIHDHPCEGCWVKSVQGTVKETVYQMDPVKGLVPEAEHYCRAGDLSYIEDSMGFHKVGNPDTQLGAVTLHCYIPPPRMARVWLAERTGPADSIQVPTCLYSAFGKRVHSGIDAATGPSIMAPAGAGEVVGSPPKPGADAALVGDKAA